MSSMVAKPRMLPNSSTTMAIPTRRVRNSRSNSLSGLGGGKRPHHVVQIGFHGKRVHVRPGNHDFPDLDLSEFHGAEDELLFARRNQAALARLLNLDLQFFRRMGNAVNLR